MLEVVGVVVFVTVWMEHLFLFWKFLCKVVQEGRADTLVVVISHVALLLPGNGLLALEVEVQAKEIPLDSILKTSIGLENSYASMVLTEMQVQLEESFLVSDDHTASVSIRIPMSLSQY